MAVVPRLSVFPRQWRPRAPLSSGADVAAESPGQLQRQMLLTLWQVELLFAGER